MYRILFLALLCSCIFSCNLPDESVTQTDQGDPAAKEIERISLEIKKNPDNAALYFTRGTKYRALKMDSLALIDFQKSVSLDSGKAGYYSAIGDLLFDHKDISGSIRWFEKALSFNPDDKTAHLKIARLFLYTGEYPKAFVSINTVLRSDVYNAEAYFLKGMCYKNMKDTAKAISSFQTSVQSDPKYADAHMQLALIYDLRRDPLALKYFENAYAADSTNMEPLYGQGMFWQKQEKYEEAKKVFKRMILVNRAYPRSYYNMGWMLLQQDSTEKAIRQFDIAIQNKPDYADAYYNRGLCKEIEGRFAESLEDYRQALSFDSNNELYRSAEARVKTKVKK